MSRKQTSGYEVSDAQASEQVEAFPVAEDPELRASVEQDTQGKVDTNHPDTNREALTRIAEEQWVAREWEIGRTHARADQRQQSSRERRSRRIAGQGSAERREQFQARAASIQQWRAPEAEDPRELLTRTELRQVNREAARLGDELREWSRAAIARCLAERVVDGADVTSAALAVFEALQQAPGTVIPIAALGEVNRPAVSIAGEIVTLWESDSPAIEQVGLIEDDTGRTKFTSWTASRPRIVEEGEHVRLRGVRKNWYQGRCSVAVIGRSRIEFPERESRWDG
jgi:hypothetical protein